MEIIISIPHSETATVEHEIKLNQINCCFADAMIESYTSLFEQFS